MAVVHRVRLLEPELDRNSALLRFLVDDVRPAAPRDEFPGMMNLQLRILDTPADLSVRLEDIDRAVDRKAVAPSGEADPLGKSGLIIFDTNVGGV